MKVLHVIPSVSKKHGGPTQAIKALTRATQVAGVEVTVLTSDDDGVNARLDVPLNQPVLRDGVTHFFFRRDLVSYKVSIGLARWLDRRASDFDLIHIHALFSFSSWAAARAARRHRVPYVIRPLGVLNRWGLEKRRPFLKRLSLSLIELPILRRAAAIHFTTESERTEALEVFPNLGGRPSFVIPIPVEISENGKADAFARIFPKVDGKQVILFLSRLDEKKGVELLLRAFARVRQIAENSVLVIAGSGDDRYVSSLRYLAKELGLENDVVWTGFVGPEKADAYAAATVFVLPSHSENFGIAAAEALAAGVPCVLSDQVALIDYLQSRESALVVPRDPVALADAIVELLSKPELGARLTSRGREIAAELFSFGAVGRNLLKMYQTIIR